jgi:adenosylmethionine-8-amino-7-oxononanoate aminotransferase
LARLTVREPGAPAIRRQLDRVAHTSFLGFTNAPAIELAKAIVELFPSGTFSRVFYSDDGSTGMEVAMRIASQYWQLHGSSRHRFFLFATLIMEIPPALPVSAQPS